MPAPDLVAAIDVGGTRIKGALVDAEGRLVHRELRDTPRADGPEAVLDAMATLLEDLARQADERGSSIRGAGAVVPGIVDDEDGVAVYAANLGWRDVPIRKLLSDRIGLPVTLGHDVRAGGLAEARLGAGRGAANVIFVPIGTGIAAAIIDSGRVLRGAGLAGEFGHVVVHPDGLPCACGGHGCLETVCSATAIVAAHAARTGRVESAETIAGRVGIDPVATEIWSTAVDALATVLITCVTLLSPEIIVIGGGLGESGEVLLEPLRRRVSSGLTFQRQPQLLGAELGQLAGVIGAGLLAWEARP